ncbi:hypothetical protein ACX9NE_03225 [Mycobacterium sp. ML4]
MSIDFQNQVAIVSDAGRGLGAGWLADADREPGAEDIAAHLAEVSATEAFTVPDSIFGEVFGVCAQLGVGTVDGGPD